MVIRTVVVASVLVVKLVVISDCVGGHPVTKSSVARHHNIPSGSFNIVPLGEAAATWLRPSSLAWYRA